MPTRDAQAFISAKIKKLRDEGYPEKQAVAIAYDYARRAGYKPARPQKSRGEALRKMTR